MDKHRGRSRSENQTSAQQHHPLAGQGQRRPDRLQRSLAPHTTTPHRQATLLGRFLPLPTNPTPQSRDTFRWTTAPHHQLRRIQIGATHQTGTEEGYTYGFSDGDFNGGFHTLSHLYCFQRRSATTCLFSHLHSFSAFPPTLCFKFTHSQRPTY